MNKGIKFDIFLSLILCFVFFQFRSSREEEINLGIIMKGVGRGTKEGFALKKQFGLLIRSLYRYTNVQNEHLLINLFIMTDAGSVPYLNNMLVNLRRIERTASSPNIEPTFLNIDNIISDYKNYIIRIKDLFTSRKAEKYFDDLFMIGPYYHKIFNFKKLIMIDADLAFRTDVRELYGLFDRFSPSQIIGVGKDLSPHYRIVLRHYRESNPGTIVGEPGTFQGYNTGVVLFDLEKIRKSELYTRIIDNENNEIRSLSDKYSFKSHLGDQCLFTLIGIEHPQLFYPLSCSYNYQLDTNLYRPPFLDIFPAYHDCPLKPKIYHGNGGTYIPDPSDEEAEKYMALG